MNKRTIYKFYYSLSVICVLMTMVFAFDACKQLSHTEKVNGNGTMMTGDSVIQLRSVADSLYQQLSEADSTIKPAIVDTLVLEIDTLQRHQPEFIVQDSLCITDSLPLANAITTNDTLAKPVENDSIQP